MVVTSGRRHRTRAKGGKGGVSFCQLQGAEGETSLPENEFHREAYLPAFIPGTRCFELSLPFYFEDVTFKIYFPFFYFHQRERVN